MGVLYYFTFYILTTKLNIPVIGREKDEEFGEEKDEAEDELELSHSKYEYMAKKVLENVGGKENVTDYENCMTRLRLVVEDMSLVDEDKIKQTGSHWVVKVDDHNLQIIVVGPQASNVNAEFKKQMEK